MGEVWRHYVAILTDPAHSLVEFTFVLIDVLIIDAVRRWIIKHLHRDLRREHHRLDKEHGIYHPSHETSEMVRSRLDREWQQGSNVRRVSG